MMGNWHGGWNGGDWLLMGFGMVLFWTLVVVAIVWVVRTSSERRPSAGHPGVSLDKPLAPARLNAREILDERYARGEIGDDEYRARRDVLTAP